MWKEKKEKIQDDKLLDSKALIDKLRRKR